LKQKGKKKKKDEEEEEGEAQLYNSDDEEDEFFDRTKVNKFHKADEKLGEGEELTYEKVKTRLEQLYRQKSRLSEQMHESLAIKRQEAEDEEDELDAFMK